MRQSLVVSNIMSVGILALVLVAVLAGCTWTTQEPPSPTTTTTNPDVEPALEAAVQRTFSLLDEGTVAFNRPDDMRVGVPARVRARVSKTEMEALYQDFETTEVIQQRKILVGTFMRLTLIGDPGAFTIHPLSTKDQPVLEQTFTEWAWDVTPQRSGTLNLHLRVSVRLQIPDHGPEILDRTVHLEQIQIDANPMYSLRKFASDNWQWLWTVVLFPAVAWGYDRWNRRRSAPAETPSTDKKPVADLGALAAAVRSRPGAGRPTRRNRRRTGRRAPRR